MVDPRVRLLVLNLDQALLDVSGSAEPIAILIADAFDAGSSVQVMGFASFATAIMFTSFTVTFALEDCVDGASLTVAVV